jgi:hypothetical protein
MHFSVPDGDKTEQVPNPWTGKLILACPMTLPQAEAFELAIDEANENIPKPEDITPESKFWWSKVDKPRLTGVLACAEKWELKDFPEMVILETFPFSPRRESHLFIEWLFDEVRKIYTNEADIPNE